RHSLLRLPGVTRGSSYSRLGIVRPAFFHLIKDNQTLRANEDFEHHVALLYVLTEKGKDILYFEDEFGPFVKSLIPSIVPQRPSTLKFLEMIKTCLQFNASYLDPDVILAFIRLVSSLVTSTNDKGETIACLQ
ncbi:Tuberinlike, partial [Caligus rogercresseyi]